MQKHLLTQGHLPTQGHLSTKGHLFSQGHLPTQGHLLTQGHLPTQGHLSSKGYMPTHGHMPTQGYLPTQDFVQQDLKSFQQHFVWFGGNTYWILSATKNRNIQIKGPFKQYLTAFVFPQDGRLKNLSHPKLYMNKIFSLFISGSKVYQVPYKFSSVYSKARLRDFQIIPWVLRWVLSNVNKQEKFSNLKVVPTVYNYYPKKSLSVDPTWIE